MAQAASRSWELDPEERTRAGSLTSQNKTHAGSGLTFKAPSWWDWWRGLSAGVMVRERKWFLKESLCGSDPNRGAAAPLLTCLCRRAPARGRAVLRPHSGPDSSFPALVFSTGHDSVRACNNRNHLFIRGGWLFIYDLGEVVHAFNRDTCYLQPGNNSVLSME